ncbi:hypothetical protein ACFS5J_06225 [Flavobacterium chuncheonense]|uniref:Lipoprotein n=1 Tax=Flavobacterium chuncheonense TaxID=2026653 RepID=A0ABW5YMF7_9FLAO
MKKLFLFLFIFSLLSCENFTKSTADILSKNNKDKVPGKYHTLKKEKIRVFLPEEFNFISLNDYRNLISRSNDTITKSRELERLNTIEKSKENIYFFEYIEAASIINILPTEYMIFNKKDAQFMLAFVSNLVRMSSPTATDFEKIEAEFKNNNRTQIFKAIFKFRVPNNELDFYKHVYFMSENNKSAFITFETPIPTSFDEYIYRTKL